MKYIKKFEDNNFLEEGDYVVLIKANRDAISNGYKFGSIYRIITVDKDTIIDYPYEITEIDNDDCYDVWVRSDEIRLAEPYEIEALKYNL